MLACISSQKHLTAEDWENVDFPLSELLNRICNEGYAFQQAYNVFVPSQGLDFAQWVDECFSSLNWAWVRVDNSRKTRQRGIDWKDALSILQSHGLEPFVIYSELADDNPSAYNIGFLLPEPVYDSWLASAILTTLSMVLTHTDHHSCAINSFLPGSTSGRLYHKENAVLDVAALFEQYMKRERAKGTANSRRNFMTYCEQTRILMEREFPGVYIAPMAVLKYIQRTDGFAGRPIMYYNGSRDSINQKSLMVKFCDPNNYPSWPNPDPPQFKIHEKYPLEKLQECRLWREVTANSLEASPLELDLLASTAAHIKGGARSFFSSLERAGIDATSAKHQVSYVRDKCFPEWTCAIAGCRYLNTCEHHSSTLDHSPVHLGLPLKCVKLPGSELSEASAEVRREELGQILDAIVASKANQIHAVKAPTGLGKTKRLLSYMLRLQQEGLTVLYAAPTHELLRQVELDLFDLAEKEEIYDGHVLRVPEVNSYLPSELASRISALYEIGAVSEGTSLIREYGKELSEKLELTDDEAEVLAFLETLDQVKSLGRNSGTIALVTHQRLLYLEIDPDIVFVDEDILLNGLIKVRTTLLSDMQHLALFSPIGPIRDYLLQQYNHIVNSAVPGQIVSPLPASVRGHEIADVAVSELENLKSNVLGFFGKSNKGFALSINYRDTLFYVVRNEISFDCKIVILSATMSKPVYESFFGERLHWHEVGPVKLAGRIMQDVSRGFSRSYFKNYEEKARAYLEELLTGKQVITAKRISASMAGWEAEVSATFGATAGLNALQGHDLCVVGTPHLIPEVYYLYAHALGESVGDINTQPKRVMVERNGFRFPFYTYTSGTLQEVQLYMIETELLQAVGRARLIDNESTVYVFSNLPLPQADLASLIRLRKAVKTDLGDEIELEESGEIF